MLHTTLHKTLLVAIPQQPLTRPHAVALLLALEETLQWPGIRDFVLDLAAVEEVDGSGLGAVVKAATEARAAGQTVYLYRPSPTVLGALHDLEIQGFFPMLEYEEDLLAHMPD